MGITPVTTNGMSRLPVTLVGYGGAMNNVMRWESWPLGVAAMGVLIQRETARVSSRPRRAELPAWSRSELTPAISRPA
jgi:hypothetical protein